MVEPSISVRIQVLSKPSTPNSTTTTQTCSSHNMYYIRRFFWGREVGLRFYITTTNWPCLSLCLIVYEHFLQKCPKINLFFKKNGFLVVEHYLANWKVLICSYTSKFYKNNVRIFTSGFWQLLSCDWWERIFSFSRNFGKEKKYNILKKFIVFISLSEVQMWKFREFKNYEKKRSFFVIEQTYLTHY